MSIDIDGFRRGLPDDPHRPPAALAYAKAGEAALRGVDPEPLEGTDRLLYSIAASLVSLTSSGYDLGDYLSGIKATLDSKL